VEEGAVVSDRGSEEGEATRDGRGCGIRRREERG